MTEDSKKSKDMPNSLFCSTWPEKQLWFQPKVDKHKLPQPRMGHSSQLWNGSQIIIYGGWNGF